MSLTVYGYTIWKIWNHMDTVCLCMWNYIYGHMNTAKWTYGIIPGWIHRNWTKKPKNQRTNGINTLWIPSSDVTRKASDFLDYTLWIPSIIHYGYVELLDYTWLDTYNSCNISGWIHKALGWIHRTLGPNTAYEPMNQWTYMDIWIQQNQPMGLYLDGYIEIEPKNQRTKEPMESIPYGYLAVM